LCADLSSLRKSASMLVNSAQGHGLGERVTGMLMSIGCAVRVPLKVGGTVDLVQRKPNAMAIRQAFRRLVEFVATLR
jgi:hypothetical protein